MKAFEYTRASSIADAAGRLGRSAVVIAGGTNLLDLMKLQVMTPERLVDITRVQGVSSIEDRDGGLVIGALVSNTELAADARVRRHYPVLSRAILAGASAQIRNKASTGGNLLQRTRCPYFYDTASPCNKRQPRTGCSARGGEARMTAILGVSDHCIAAHPSDMAVAMRALDARVEVQGAGDKTRLIALDDLYRLPNDRPDLETTLAADEIISAVHVPKPPVGAVHAYRKVRDRASYAFALVSVAALVTMKDDCIDTASLAFGGLASHPWRDRAVEDALRGEAPSDDLFGRAADILLTDARTEPTNRFKLSLAKRTLVSVLRECTGLSPRSTGTDPARSMPDD